MPLRSLQQRFYASIASHGTATYRLVLGRCGGICEIFCEMRPRLCVTLELWWGRREQPPDLPRAKLTDAYRIVPRLAITWRLPRLNCPWSYRLVSHHLTLCRVVFPWHMGFSWDRM